MCTFLRIGILIVALSLLVQGDTDLAREPQQGTFITCEECVILYPEKYRDNPAYFEITNHSEDAEAATKETRRE